MSETKLKIIKGAQELFFENGIANIRLQQIADSSGISVGNLAYHLKIKMLLFMHYMIIFLMNYLKFSHNT